MSVAAGGFQMAKWRRSAERSTETPTSFPRLRALLDEAHEQLHDGIVVGPAPHRAHPAAERAAAQGGGCGCGGGGYWAEHLAALGHANQASLIVAPQLHERAGPQARRCGLDQARFVELDVHFFGRHSRRSAMSR